MSESTASPHNVFELSLDPRHLTKNAINAVRASLGLMGVVGVILGVMVLIWPGATLIGVGILFGLYFLVSGIIRAGVGIFARGLSGGIRALDIILGVLLIVGGVVAIKNVALTLVLLTAVIGIGWIIEGIVALVESGGSESKGLTIVLGIVSVLAGFVLLVLPVQSIAFMVIYGGIALLILGIVQIVRAFTFGRAVLKANASS